MFVCTGKTNEEVEQDCARRVRRQRQVVWDRFAAAALRAATPTLAALRAAPMMAERDKRRKEGK